MRPEGERDGCCGQQEAGAQPDAHAGSRSVAESFLHEPLPVLRRIVELEAPRVSHRAAVQESHVVWELGRVRAGRAPPAPHGARVERGVQCGHLPSPVQLARGGDDAPGAFVGRRRVAGPARSWRALHGHAAGAIRCEEVDCGHIHAHLRMAPTRTLHGWRCCLLVHAHMSHLARAADKVRARVEQAHLEGAVPEVSPQMEGSGEQDHADSSTRQGARYARARSSGLSEHEAVPSSCSSSARPPGGGLPSRGARVCSALRARWRALSGRGRWSLLPSEEQGYLLHGAGDSCHQGHGGNGGEAAGQAPRVAQPWGDWRICGLDGVGLALLGAIPRQQGGWRRRRCRLMARTCGTGSSGGGARGSPHAGGGLRRRGARCEVSRGRRCHSMVCAVLAMLVVVVVVVCVLVLVLVPTHRGSGGGRGRRFGTMGVMLAMLMCVRMVVGVVLTLARARHESGGGRGRGSLARWRGQRGMASLLVVMGVVFVVGVPAFVV
mmetsp:Transcript_15013/g.45978  ORF Transcript_15013/g.45978 Transcript_15013/m.45978 type:complete len:493 (+) Transcript_15013:533-2011(+)